MCRPSTLYNLGDVITNVLVGKDSCIPWKDTEVITKSLSVLYSAIQLLEIVVEFSKWIAYVTSLIACSDCPNETRTYMMVDMSLKIISPK